MVLEYITQGYFWLYSAITFTLPTEAVGWVEMAVGVSALLTPVTYYLYVRFIRKRIKRACELFVSLGDMVDYFPKLKEAAEQFTLEFTPNGETAAIDKININSKNLAEMKSQQGQQTSMLHSVMATLPGAWTWVDVHGEVSVVSKGFTVMTGMDLNSMQNGGWRLFIHPEDVMEVDRVWARSLHDKQTFYLIFRICNVLHKDRGYFKVEVTSILLPLDGGWKTAFEKVAEKKPGVKSIPFVDEIDAAKLANPLIPDSNQTERS